VQWQILTALKSSVTSKRTAPQWQLPDMLTRSRPSAA
jgi:hypothetical protein